MCMQLSCQVIKTELMTDIVKKCQFFKRSDATKTLVCISME